MKKLFFNVKCLKMLAMVLLIFSIYPAKAATETAQFGELDEKGLEQALQFGDSVKDEKQWRESAKSVKDKQKAAWEYSVEKLIADKMGISLEQAVSNNLTNPEFLAAKAKWEEDAAKIIEKKFGSWKGKNDWSYNLNAGGMRAKIAGWVWEDKADISDVEGNIVKMKERVLSNWQDYADYYNAGLGNLLDNLMDNADGMSDPAKDSYIEALRATAQAHREAVAGIGQNFICLEEAKYLKYMARIMIYQQYADSNSMVYDGNQASSNMQDSITNVNSGASNLYDPIAMAQAQIESVRSNIYDISGGLGVADTGEENLTVGIYNWEEMVRNKYQSGMDQWKTALDNLTLQMNRWFDNATNGYSVGSQTWLAAYQNITAARNEWSSNMQVVLNAGISNWNSKIDLSRENMAQSLLQLQTEIGRTEEAYSEYSSGLMKVYLEGSQTLLTVNNNIDWMTNRMPIMTSNLQYWQNQMAMTNQAMNSLSAILPTMSLGKTLVYQMMSNNFTGSSYNGYQVDYKPTSAMYYNAQQWTLHMNGYQVRMLREMSYNGPINGPWTIITNYTFNYIYNGGSLDAGSLSNQISNAIGIYTLQTNDLYQNHVFTASNDLMSVSNQIGTWLQMKLNYSSLISQSKSQLLTNLYSSELGDGLFMDNTNSDGIDLYLKSQNEMKYAQANEELKYLKQRLDIAQAVLNYANNYGNLSGEEASNQIDILTGQMSQAQSDVGAAELSLSNSLLAVNAANTIVAANGLGLADAKKAMDDAMAAYEAAKKNLEKQQNIAAILEAGVTNVQAQATNFVNRALAEYVSSLTYYENSQKSYYMLYQQNVFGKVEDGYYTTLSNALTQGGIYSDSALSAEALVSGNLLDAYGVSGGVAKTMIDEATNTGIELGARGRLEEEASLSNEYKNLYQSIAQALQSKDKSALIAYTNSSLWGDSGYNLIKANYTKLVMNGVSDFLRQWDGITDLKTAFNIWSSGFQAQLTYGVTGKSLLYGVWKYVSTDARIQNALSGGDWADDKSVIAQECVDNAALVNEFWAGYTQDNGGNGLQAAALSFLKDKLGDAAAGALSTQDYNSMESMLLLSGKNTFSGLYELCDSSMKDLIEAKDAFATFAKQAAGEALARLDAVEGFEEIGRTIAEADNTAALTGAVNDLKGLKGKYGEAMDAYIDEMITKAAGLNMDPQALTFATNQLSHISGQIDSNNRTYNDLGQLLNTQPSMKVEYLNSIGMSLADKSGPEWTGINSALRAVILKEAGIPSGDLNEDQLLAGLRDAVSKYSNQLLGGTVDGVMDDISGEYIRNYIQGRVSSEIAVNGTNNTAFLADAFGALSGDDRAFAEKYYNLKACESLGVKNSEWDNYTNLLRISEDFSKSNYAGIAGDDYGKWLLATVDYRGYESLNDKTFVDAGMTSVEDYILRDSTGALLAKNCNDFMSWGLQKIMTSLLGQMNDTGSNLNVLSESNALVQNQVSAYYRAQGADQMRSNLTVIDSLTTNISSGGGFDSIDTNGNLTANKDISDAWNSLYSQYKGLTEIISNYNAQRSNFISAISNIQTNGRYTVTSENGALADKYQTYMGSYGIWTGAEEKMAQWAIAYQNASGGDYTKSVGFVTARTNFEALGTNMTAIQSNYYAQADSYSAALSDYYGKLADSGRKAKDRDAASLEYREIAAQYNYAILPFLAGMNIDTGANGFAGISNLIDAQGDYKDALALYSAKTNEMGTLQQTILHERQVKAEVEVELQGYKNDYANYLELVQAADLIGQKEAPAVERVNDTKQDYEDALRCVVDTSSDVAKSVGEKIANGTITIGTIDSLVQEELPSLAWNIFTSKYYNDNNIKDLYQLMYGIRSYDYVTNDIGAKLDAVNSSLGQIGIGLSTLGIQTYVGFANVKGLCYDLRGMKSTLFFLANEAHLGGASDSLSKVNDLIGYIEGHYSWVKGNAPEAESQGSIPEASSIKDLMNTYVSAANEGDLHERAKSFGGIWGSIGQYMHPFDLSTLLYLRSQTGQYQYIQGTFTELFTNYQAYDAARKVADQYSIDVTAYTNGDRKLDAANTGSAFFQSVVNNIKSITGTFDLTAMTNVFAAQSQWIISTINDSLPAGGASDGKVSLNLILNTLKQASLRMMANEKESVHSKYISVDSQDKIFNEAMAGIMTNLQGNYQLDTAGFREVTSNIGAIALESYRKAKEEEADIQAGRWQLQLNDTVAQRDAWTNNWTASIVTGAAHWNSALDGFAAAYQKWQTDYENAVNDGMQIWTDKTNTLVQRRDAWVMMAINSISYGSMDFLNDDLMNSFRDRTMSLINDDLPEDVSKTLQVKARELQSKILPQSADGYKAFFGQMLAQTSNANVTFVLDGLSRFGGDSTLVREYDNQMKSLKEAQVALALVKMKEDFRDEMGNLVNKFNKSISQQDKHEKLFTLQPLAQNAGFGLEGSEWVKHDVVVGSTLFGGDEKETFRFSDYREFAKRLDVNQYTTKDILEGLKGRQTKYDLMLAIEKEKAGNDFKALMSDFSDNHMGEFFSGSADSYNNNESHELYRMSKAVAYFGMKEAIGRAAADAPVWDKPFAKGVNVTLFRVVQVTGGIALSCIPYVGPIVSAAVVAGMEVAHDAYNVAKGYMKASEFGISVLKDVLVAVASVATAGIGSAAASAAQAGNAMASMGLAVAGAAVNTTANLATSGLHLNENGQMDWSLTKDQWASQGISAVASMGAAAFNSGYSENNMTIADHFGQNLGNWAINTASSTINKGWKVNSSGNLDWSMSGDDWTEAMVHSGVTLASTAVNTWGAGDKGGDNFLSYAATKGLSMAEYSMYQSGWFGDGLKNKYFGQNTFDLAGGVDLTIFSGGPTRFGSSGLQITSQGVTLHQGAGEFSGLGLSLGDGGLTWNARKTWENTMDSLKEGGRRISQMANGVGSSIGGVINGIGQGIGNVINSLGQMSLPWQKTPQGERNYEASNMPFLREEDRYKPKEMPFMLIGADMSHLQNNTDGKKSVMDHLTGDNSGMVTLDELKTLGDEAKVGKKTTIEDANGNEIKVTPVTVKIDDGTTKVVYFDSKGKAVSDVTTTVADGGKVIEKTNYDKNGDALNYRSTLKDGNGKTLKVDYEDYQNGYSTENFMDASGKEVSQRNYYSMNGNGDFELQYKDMFVHNSDGLVVKYPKQGNSPYGSDPINGDSVTYNASQVYVNGHMGNQGCTISAESIMLTYHGYPITPGEYNQEARGIDGAFDGINLTGPLDVAQSYTGNSRLRDQYYFSQDSGTERANENNPTSLSDMQNEIETQMSDNEPVILRYALPTKWDEKGHSMVASGCRVDANGNIDGYLVSDPGWSNLDYKSGLEREYARFIEKSSMIFDKVPSYKIYFIKWYNNW